MLQQVRRASYGRARQAGDSSEICGNCEVGWILKSDIKKLEIADVGRILKPKFESVKFKMEIAKVGRILKE